MSNSGGGGSSSNVSYYPVSWDRYLEFIRTVPVSQEDLEFFQKNQPPCGRSYLDRATTAYTPIPFFSRYPKDDSGDTFFSRTINSSDTVRHLLTLIRKDVLYPGAGETLEALLSAANRDQPHLVVLVDIGSGLNGFRDTVHGGVLASLVDESMASCVEVFRQCYLADRAYLYTADLQLSYRAPVTSPGVVAIKVNVTRREGRKWILEAVIVDAQGKVLVEAKALWIQARGQASL